jgi:hypothetical protein
MRDNVKGYGYNFSYMQTYFPFAQMYKQ